MILKKLIAGTLSILICSSAVTSTNVVNLINNNTKQGSSNSVSNENDYELKSSNSLGNYITAMAEANNNGSSESDNSEKNFTISNLDFDDKTGKILIQSTQTSNCKAVVSFIDDITCKNVLEKVIDVNEGNSTISEATVNTLSLPEFYLVKAQLVDESGNVLSSVFTFNKYTEEMQEILAADIHDFNEDYVVSFDESEDTNFIVLNEQTVIIESSETENTLVSADYDNNVYVFENADEDIKSLESGEYLYVQPNENDIIAVSVEDVDFNDNQVTVTGDSENIDNMFDFIKFESDSSEGETTVDTSVSDEYIEFPELDENKSIHKFADGDVLNFTYNNNKKLSFNGSSSKEISFNFGKSDVTDLVSDEPLSATLKGKLKIEAELNFYKRFSYINVEFALKPSLSLEFEAGFEGGTDSILSSKNAINLGLKIAKFTLATSIPGVLIDTEPKAVIEFSAKIKVTLSANPIIGFSYDSDNGFQNTSNSLADCFNADLSVEGSIELKLVFNPSIVFVSRKIAYVSIEAAVGAKISVELPIENELLNSNSEKISLINSNNESVHGCTLCAEGGIAFICSVEVVASFLKHEVSATLLDLEVPIPELSFHVSRQAGFGWGECNYKKFKTLFNVCDSNGNKIEDAVVTLSDSEDEVKCITDSSGCAKFYCPNSSYSYNVELDGKKLKSGSISINNASKSIDIAVSVSVDKDGNVKYGSANANSSDGSKVTTTAHVPRKTATTTKTTLKTLTSKYGIVETGSLGKNITYTLHNDGYLWIHGYGDMNDFSSSPFGNSKLIKEVIIENENENKVITSLGNNLFCNCSNMKSLDLPQSIKRIGTSAFYNCAALNDIRYNNKSASRFVLPNLLTSLGDYAFSGCTSIKFGALTVPNTVISIGNYAFSGCKGLTSVTVPGTVKTIGSYAFSGCTSLKTAVIKNGVESIGVRTFSDCTALESLTLPYAGLSENKIEENSYPLYAQLFNYSTVEGTYNAGSYGIPEKLTSITITGGTRIPNSAFYGMSSLKTINIPNTITSIGDYAFYGCSSMESSTLPSELTYIGNYALYGCNSAKFGALTIPNTVTLIGNNAFANCKGLTSVTVPGTVKTIGSYAFSGCTSLKTAVIKNGVESIGVRTFSDCTALESLTLPYAGLSENKIEENSYPLYAQLFNYSTVEGTYNAGSYGIPEKLTSITITGGTRIPNSAFYGMSSLKTINIPNTITSIGDYAFYGCSSMESSTLPSELTYIGNYALYGCNSAKFGALTIPNTVTLIGNNAFANCKGLTSVTVPGTVKTIGSYAFSGCTSLKTAVIKNGVESIGVRTFSDCTALESLTLPYAGLSENKIEENSYPLYAQLFNYSTVEGTYNAGSYGVPKKLTSITITGGTRIPNSAFYGMSSLKTINIPNTITSIGDYAFYGCTLMETGILPSKLISIGNNAFNGCNSAKFGELNISTTVKSLGNYAFANCNGLISVTVPGSVKTIGQYAFSSCTSLKNAVIKSGVESIGVRTFSDCTALESLTLPYAGLNKESIDKNTNPLYAYLFSSRVIEGTYNAGSYGIPKTLTSITITGGTRIPNSAFYRMSSLKTINIPNTITSIGDYAFYGCTGLSKLYIDKTPIIWANVTIGNNNDVIYVVNKVFNSISIKTQPKSVIVAVNSTAKFTIKATGDNLKYQWQYSKDNGENWINCSNASSKTNTLNWVAAANRNNYLCRCVIKDANGFTTVSKAATLTIKTKLEITKQPESVTAEINKTAEFKVQVTGDNLKYQWQYSKDNGGNWINSSNPSSTTDTFNLVAAANRNNFLVRCVITDEYGEIIESDSAVLTIKTKLEIIKQPESVTAEINKTAEFTVEATGDNLKYQWQYSRDNGGNWINSSNPSSTTDTFNLVAAANRNNFLVRCVITDEYGEIIESDSAILTIRTKLEIIKQPESVTAEVNKTAEFTVGATGDNLKYQWQYSRDNGENWINSSNPSSTTDTFNLVAAANRNNFLVRCVITDKYGETIESDSAVLTVAK